MGRGMIGAMLGSTSGDCRSVMLDQRFVGGTEIVAHVMARSDLKPGTGRESGRGGMMERGRMVVVRGSWWWWWGREGVRAIGVGVEVVRRERESERMMMECMLGYCILVVSRRRRRNRISRSVDLDRSIDRGERRG